MLKNYYICFFWAIVKDYTMLDFILVFALSYLIGAVPFSSLMLRTLFRKDITQKGSTSAGAMNAYRVSQRISVGILVFLFDLLKAIAPIIIVPRFCTFSFPMLLVITVGVLLGHKFNVFLKFKGGVGLSSGLGIIAMLNFLPAIYWMAAWVFSYMHKKDMNNSIIFACFMCLGLSFLTTEDIFSSFHVYVDITHSQLLSIISIINVLILANKLLYVDVKPE